MNASLQRVRTSSTLTTSLDALFTQEPFCEFSLYGRCSSGRGNMSKGYCRCCRNLCNCDKLTTW